MIMKNRYFTLLLLAMPLIASCNQDDKPEMDDIYLKGNICTIDTFTSATPDACDDYIVSWSDDDVIAIMSEDGKMDSFKLDVSLTDPTVACILGGEEILKENMRYIACHPSGKEYIDLSNQKQKGDSCCASDYDFIFSDWQEVNAGMLRFDFHHAGALVAVELYLQKTGAYKSLKLRSIDNDSIFCNQGTVDLSAEHPAFQAMDKSREMVLTLEDYNNYEGQTVRFYLMMAPSDLSGKELAIELSTETDTFRYSIHGRRLEAGNFYVMKAEPEHEYVDFGLSVCWAKMNVGSQSPMGFGDYFGWGETEPYYQYGYNLDITGNKWKEGKTGYDWYSYKYCAGNSISEITRYCNNPSYGLNGFTDGKTRLEADDDVATVLWGDGWRMPTAEEFKELWNSRDVVWEFETDYNGTGICGFTITSFKGGVRGDHIFLPTAGYRYASGRYYSDFYGTRGMYWTSDVDTEYPYNARYFRYEFDGRYFNGNVKNLYRCYGLPIRPVRPR